MNKSGLKRFDQKEFTSLADAFAQARETSRGIHTFNLLAVVRDFGPIKETNGTGKR